MLGTLVFALALAAPSPDEFRPAIWPEFLGGDWERTSAAPAQGDPILTEYGLQTVETAEYRQSHRKLTTTGYRFRDAVGGYAGYLLLRPADGKPADYPDDASASGETTVIRFGNYVLKFQGGMPDYPVFEELLAYLPKLDQTELSPLRTFLPANAFPNSERYILGPGSLSKFFPEVPPSTAAFRAGAEGIAARYGEGTLAVFSYPSEAIAARRCPEFRSLAGVNVNCTGPLVAVASGQGLVQRVAYAPPPARWGGAPEEPAMWPAWAAVSLAVLIGLALAWWLRSRSSRTPASAELTFRIGR